MVRVYGSLGRQIWGKEERQRKKRMMEWMSSNNDNQINIQVCVRLERDG